MPEIPEIDSSRLDQFIDQNLVLIVVVAVLLVLLYVGAPRLVHATVPRMLEAQAGDLEQGGVHSAELDKRAETLESLSITLIRLTAVSGLGLIVVGLFGLWSVLTGVALFLAAVTLAGQSIVLDYLMGIFIVVEGTFFKGDNIEFNQLRGEVEDVGLRRTIVRGTDGTVHSISNGELRIVSNRTRIYASAEVQVRGIREEDLESVIAIMDRVGQAVASEPEFTDDILEAHRLRYIEDPDELGITAVMRGRVLAASRWSVATEIRRRLNQAFLEEGIELNKRGIAPRLPRSGSSTAAGAAGAIVDADADD